MFRRVCTDGARRRSTDGQPYSLINKEEREFLNIPKADGVQDTAIQDACTTILEAAEEGGTAGPDQVKRALAGAIEAVLRKVFTVYRETAVKAREVEAQNRKLEAHLLESQSSSLKEVSRLKSVVRKVELGELALGADRTQIWDPIAHLPEKYQEFVKDLVTEEVKNRLECSGTALPRPAPEQPAPDPSTPAQQDSLESQWIQELQEQIQALHDKGDQTRRENVALKAEVEQLREARQFSPGGPQSNSAETDALREELNTLRTQLAVEVEAWRAQVQMLKTKEEDSGKQVIQLQEDLETMAKHLETETAAAHSRAVEAADREAQLQGEIRDLKAALEAPRQPGSTSAPTPEPPSRQLSQTSARRPSVDQAGAELAAALKKNGELQDEVDRLNMILSQTGGQLQQLRQVAVEKGFSEQMEDALQVAGLDTVMEGLQGRSRKVFDRLYEDAVRRITKLAKMQASGVMAQFRSDPRTVLRPSLMRSRTPPASTSATLLDSAELLGQASLARPQRLAPSGGLYYRSGGEQGATAWKSLGKLSEGREGDLRPHVEPYCPSATLPGKGRTRMSPGRRAPDMPPLVHRGPGLRPTASLPQLSRTIHLPGVSPVPHRTDLGLSGRVSSIDFTRNKGLLR
mmetsp:Transcript_105952/g.242603  ORF Transcript_105952/g.242603 Transcript_105952/m.242603 type:complete len:631 (-) Transcript_105952:163-2055(-)